MTSPEEDKTPPPCKASWCGIGWDDAKEDGEQLAAREYRGGIPPLDVVGSWLLSTEPLVMEDEVVQMLFPEDELY